MTEKILQEIENELNEAVKKNGHPFRFFSFGTQIENGPTLRTVVLRKVNNDFSFVFYADIRSEKVKQLQANSNCCALFYNSEKMIQVKVEGTAKINSKEINLEEIWSSIPEHSKKDYSTTNPPGSMLEKPSAIQYLDRSNHFSVITIVPTSIEYLKITQPNHIRVEFIKDNGNWEGRYLVP